MAAPMNAGFPSGGLDLGGGYTLEVTALDASAGTDVTAVKISAAVITVENLSATLTPPELVTGPFMLVPGPNA